MFPRSWFPRFYYQPDDPGGAAPPDSGSGGQAPPSSPASPPVSSAPPASPGGVMHTESDFTSIRDAFKPLGYDFTGLPDDSAAVQQIALQLRQAQEYQRQAQEWQRVQPRYSEFQKWEQQEQARIQAAEAKKNEWWKPIDYDESRFRQLLTTDPQGNVVPRPGSGATMQTVQEYHETLQRKLQFEQQFLKNPVEAMRPGLEQLVRAEAEKLIKQNLSQFESNAFAKSFEERETNWLHAVDPVTGQKGYSAEGQKFLGYIQEGKQLGITDFRSLEAYARKCLAGDLGMQLIQRQQPGQPPAPADPRQALLQQHNRNTPGNLANPDLQNGGGQAVQQGGQRDMLKTMLRADLAKAGCSLAADFNGF